jgi:hypothetical protein
MALGPADPAASENLVVDRTVVGMAINFPLSEGSFE